MSKRDEVLGQIVEEALQKIALYISVTRKDSDEFCKQVDSFCYAFIKDAIKLGVEFPHGAEIHKVLELFSENGK